LEVRVFEEKNSLHKAVLFLQLSNGCFTQKLAASGLAFGFALLISAKRFCLQEQQRIGWKDHGPNLKEASILKHLR